MIETFLFVRFGEEEVCFDSPDGGTGLCLGLTCSSWCVFVVRYHMTSIYDISVYEGLSRVIQRLIPQQPALERLLNGFALVSQTIHSIGLYTYT